MKSVKTSLGQQDVFVPTVSTLNTKVILTVWGGRFGLALTGLKQQKQKQHNLAS